MHHSACQMDNRTESEDGFAQEVVLAVPDEAIIGLLHQLHQHSDMQLLFSQPGRGMFALIDLRV